MRLRLGLPEIGSLVRWCLTPEGAFPLSRGGGKRGFAYPQWLDTLTSDVSFDPCSVHVIFLGREPDRQSAPLLGSHSKLCGTEHGAREGGRARGGVDCALVAVIEATPLRCRVAGRDTKVSAEAAVRRYREAHRHLQGDGAQVVCSTECTRHRIALYPSATAVAHVEVWCPFQEARPGPLTRGAEVFLLLLKRTSAAAQQVVPTASWSPER